MVLNKYLKNISLKGRQIISLSGVPTCLSLVLLVVQFIAALSSKIILEVQPHNSFIK
jgi:hypothetical protein